LPLSSVVGLPETFARSKLSTFNLRHALFAIVVTAAVCAATFFGLQFLMSLN